MPQGLFFFCSNQHKLFRVLTEKIGPVLPHEIQEKLNCLEEEYFRSHSSAIKSYISELDIDLTVGMVPPRDPYIQVWVLEDFGEVSLGDHSISLTKICSTSLGAQMQNNLYHMFAICYAIFSHSEILIFPVRIIFCLILIGSHGRISGLGITYDVK